MRRSNNFRDYYIQMDLTYRQRGEVMANRAARVHNNVVEQPAGGTFARRESLSSMYRNPMGSNHRVGTACQGASYGRGQVVLLLLVVPSWGSFNIGARCFNEWFCEGIS